MCCSHAGFAILENVLLIYEAYEKGLLKRTDYEFPAGLSFKDFVFKYFDVYIEPVKKWFRKRALVAFRMKSLSSNDNLISIPAVGYYYDARAALFDQNPWLSKGCVFLNKRIPDCSVDDGDSSRYCILHDEQSATHLTTKPIDCVFFTCHKSLEPKVPDPGTSRKWFRALATCYSNSIERFEGLLQNDNVGCKRP